MDLLVMFAARLARVAIDPTGVVVMGGAVWMGWTLRPAWWPALLAVGVALVNYIIVAEMRHSYGLTPPGFVSMAMACLLLAFAAFGVGRWLTDLSAPR